MSSIKL